MGSLVQFHNGKAAGSIYGRGLYEVMRYWDGENWDQDDPAMGDDLRAFAETWRAMQWAECDVDRR